MDANAELLLRALSDPKEAQAVMAGFKKQVDELKAHEGAEKRHRAAEADAKEAINQVASMQQRLAAERADFVRESQSGAASLQDGWDKIRVAEKELTRRSAGLDLRESAVIGNEAALAREQKKLAAAQAVFQQKREKLNAWLKMVRSLDVSDL